MFSIRMRAEGKGGEHVSGAEGIYRAPQLGRAVSKYIHRAHAHPRGAAHAVTITVEQLASEPLTLRALKVSTLDTASPAHARRAASRELSALGISDSAIAAAFEVLQSRTQMRGAALIDSLSGQRLDPDLARGVRASRLGLTTRGRAALGRRLARLGINTETVREALTLASKVASAPGIVAELCASDDPQYTTGYMASRTTGYVRLLSIKKSGSRCGGRVFFVTPGSDMKTLLKYLQQTAVLVDG